MEDASKPRKNGTAVKIGDVVSIAIFAFLVLHLVHKIYADSIEHKLRGAEAESRALATKLYMARYEAEAPRKELEAMAGVWRLQTLRTDPARANSSPAALNSSAVPVELAVSVEDGLTKIGIKQTNSAVAEVLGTGGLVTYAFDNKPYSAGRYLVIETTNGGHVSFNVGYDGRKELMLRNGDGQWLTFIRLK